MFGSGVLDTVIGLVFVFLLVSLIVTTANELISAIIRSRAKWLEYGVHRLIGSTWAKQLFAHPLVEGSTQHWTPAGADRAATPGAPGARVNADAKLRWRGAGPSYIPSRTFANIVMELLQGADKVLRETERVLHSTLEVASAGASTVNEIKAAVDSMAAALPANLPPHITAAITADLTQLSAILGRNAAGRLTGWLAEVESHAQTLGETFREAKTDLAAIVVSARDGTLAFPQIRHDMIKAMNKLPAGPTGDAIRADLNLVLSRLEGGYSVGDAVADVQRFIRGVPAGYVRQLILSLPDADARMRQTLLTLFDDAANDVEKFKQNIEVWFNNAMDRVGGWYKRRAQTVTFGISVAVVVLMNVDALLVVRYLDANPKVAKALATQAQAFVDAKARETPGKEPAAPVQPVAGDSVTGTLHFSFTREPTEPVKAVFSTTEGGTFRPAWVMVEKASTSVPYTLETAFAEKTGKATISATIPGAQVKPDTLEIQPSYPAQLRHIQEQLMGLKLPIGWSRDATQAERDMHLGLAKWDDRGEYWDALTFHFFGWLITAIAATLGAPFWFDMLNKIMSIRSAGKSPEEKPKSPDVVQAPMAPGQSPGEASRLAAIAKSGHH